VASVLATTGERNQPSVDAVAYRTVRATGRYDAAGQRLLRNQSQGGVNGFDVITPLRTGTAVLLIDRGFVAADRNGNPPTAVPAPPTGPVTVDARVQPGSGRRDTAARGQIEAVNPSAQAGRLHAAVYTDYADLLPGQPGTAGLRPKPRPSLYNPAGGAVEPQHFAYVIQWFLFALLALAAPFAMIRADRRDRSDDDPEPTTALSPEEARAARLADRYGRAIR
jgi:cytochrome oxidase assembly protein ShyY1